MLSDLTSFGRTGMLHTSFGRTGPGYDLPPAVTKFAKEGFENLANGAVTGIQGMFDEKTDDQVIVKYMPHIGGDPVK